MRTKRLNVILMSLTCVFLFLTTSACVQKNVYQNKWPDFQHKIKAGPTESRIVVDLPQNIKIIDPSHDIPPAISKCSGIWHGNVDRHKTTDMKLAVEEIYSDGNTYSARIVYATASGRRNWKPIILNLKGKFVNNELQVVLPGDKEMVFYRIRTDGKLDVKWIEIDSKKWAVGVMVKQPM